MKTKTTPKTPSIRKIRALLISLKSQIGDECRCTDDSEDDKPGMLVTIGANDAGNWNYQIGDNSFTGGAYGFPHWGLAYLYRRSNCTELARQVIDEIAESQAQSAE